MQTVAYDLGSNTLRAIRYDCVTGKTVGVFERIVKTADRLVETGRIDDAAVDRVVDAVLAAHKALACDETTHVVAYATEALRRASNRDAVLRRIYDETQVTFEIIDGNTEARLTLLAVRKRLHALGLQTQRIVMVDIGGGSTELVFACDDTIYMQSFPIGIVTVAQQYKELHRIQAAMPELIEPIRRFAQDAASRCGRIDTFVATAGTPTTVAAMKHGQTYATYDPAVINGTILEKKALRFYLDRLLAMPFAKREETVGVGRSDLIAAGIVIFEAIYHALHMQHCVVIDDGLREGAAIEACRNICDGSAFVE